MNEYHYFLPVYFVVVEPVSPAQTRIYQMQVLDILKVVEGDLSDYSEIYDTYVAPLVATGRNVFYYVFYRVPSNPFGYRALFDMIKEFIQKEKEKAPDMKGTIYETFKEGTE